MSVLRMNVELVIVDLERICFGLKFVRRVGVILRGVGVLEDMFGWVYEEERCIEDKR